MKSVVACGTCVAFLPQQTNMASFTSKSSCIHAARWAPCMQSRPFHSLKSQSMHCNDSAGWQFLECTDSLIHAMLATVKVTTPACVFTPPGRATDSASAVHIKTSHQDIPNTPEPCPCMKIGCTAVHCARPVLSHMQVKHELNTTARAMSHDPH